MQTGLRARGHRSRREFLQQAAAFGIVLCAPRSLAFAAGWRAAKDPFTLGVASGFSTPGGVVLWTRLAPEPFAPGGGLPPEAIAVRWQVAEDEAMRRVVQSDTSWASPEWGHAVHVEVGGLAPDRPYWYRFEAGKAASPIGRTRTAPSNDADPKRCRFAVASCQHYEQGYYGAYRQMLADDLDYVIFVGDYIYESSWGTDRVRSHRSSETYTLDDYRARYALYRTDPDLQAAHAAYPWLVTWDDHEVDNDYAGARSEDLEVADAFLLRRAAAYKAYYEHMPLPRRAVPFGPWSRVYARQPFGRLADFILLDDRQYRDPQVCPKPGRGGSNVVTDCRERLDPARTLLGRDQEAWLAAGLAAGEARWNVIVQQTRVAPFDLKAGAGEQWWTDGWDGYPAARQRLLDALAVRPARNPLIVGGDVHSFWVTDLHADPSKPKTPIVASEFVTTSISSPGPGQALFDAVPENPHVRFATGEYRGYTCIELGPQRADVELRAMESVATPAAPCRTLARFSVEDGRPGASRA